MAYFGVIFFANMGGGGGQNYFHSMVFDISVVSMISVNSALNFSGPVLRDAARLSQRYPPNARYGVFGVST